MYDPEEASFYSLPSEVGRKMLSGGNMTSPVAATGRSTYSPFDLVKPSKPLICITTGTPALNTPHSFIIIIISIIIHEYD